jgi:hypothetical protein
MQERRYEVYNMNHLKGEALNVGFDRGIKLEFHGAKVTSDGGLLAHRDQSSRAQQVCDRSNGAWGG